MKLSSHSPGSRPCLPNFARKQLPTARASIWWFNYLAAVSITITPPFRAYIRTAFFVSNLRRVATWWLHPILCSTGPDFTLTEHHWETTPLLALQQVIQKLMDFDWFTRREGRTESLRKTFGIVPPRSCWDVTEKNRQSQSPPVTVVVAVVRPGPAGRHTSKRERRLKLPQQWISSTSIYGAARGWGWGYTSTLLCKSLGSHPSRVFCSRWTNWN